MLICQDSRCPLLRLNHLVTESEVALRLIGLQQLWAVYLMVPVLTGNRDRHEIRWNRIPPERTEKKSSMPKAYQLSNIIAITVFLDAWNEL